MHIKTFWLFPNYNTISVFNHFMEEPFNDWTLELFRQGFSWRPQSVSFRCLSSLGQLLVNVSTEDEMTVNRNYKRAIIVPFYVNENKKVSFSDAITSFEAEEAIYLDSGWYKLLFCIGWEQDQQFCDLKFLNPEIAASTAEIHILDDELSPEYPLVMNAHPA